MPKIISEQKIDEIDYNGYICGLRDAIALMDTNLPGSEFHAHLLLTIQRIENRILNKEIEKLSNKIKEMQEKINQYEKG